MFDPMTIPAPAQPAPDPAAGIAPIAPISSPPPAPPAILFAKPEPKANKKTWDAAIVRKAQGIYPAEAQAKQAQVNNAKMPTPTGAWGSPQ